LRRRERKLKTDGDERMNTDKIYSDAVASLMDLRDLFDETQEDDWYEKIQKMMDDISDKWEEDE
jgi:hypothetical protein